MKLISFYTKDTIYEKEVEDLKHSCEALSIDHYIEERKDLGTWEKNCAQKPLFIYECLKKFKRPLLWVDADGIVLKKPSIDLKLCDFGLYFNNFRTRHARSATIYIRPTESAKQFLLLWYETLQKKSHLHDQPVMIDLLRKEKIKVAKLPIEYMQIFDRDKVPLEKTVILHFQASRTAKMAPIFWQNLTGRELKAMRIGVSQF